MHQLLSQENLFPYIILLFLFGAIHMMYSCIRGEDIISPVANRNIPKNTSDADDVTEIPKITNPKAAINKPNRNEGIALLFSKMREIISWKNNNNITGMRDSFSIDHPNAIVLC